MSRLLSCRTYLPQYGGPPKLVVLAGLVHLVGVVPVHVAVAAVGVGHRRERDDHVVADLAEERRLVGGQPVGQLHEHLRRAGLGAVEAGHDVVDRLGLGDHLLRLLLGQLPRVGELREARAVALEVGDRLGGGDGDHHQRPALVRGADLDDLDPRRRRGERAVVAEDVLVVREPLRLAHVVPDDVSRRGDAGDERKVVHQRAEELGPGGPLAHEAGELGVGRRRGLLRGRGGTRRQAGAGDRPERGEQKQGQK